MKPFRRRRVELRQALMKDLASCLLSFIGQTAAQLQVSRRAVKETIDQGFEVEGRPADKQRTLVP